MPRPGWIVDVPTLDDLKRSAAQNRLIGVASG
jgi:hypothetical protein